MTSLAQLFKDPPPTHAFELSAAGISFAKLGQVAEIGFRPFESGFLSISPVHDNIHNPEGLLAGIKEIAPPNGNRKRPAALILPDYCARVAVLGFDAFPSTPEEQLALIRFRMKKTVPFDVDHAMVSFVPQPRSAQTKEIEVLVAVMASEIVLRYEEQFRNAGFWPGLVTTSSVAMLNLVQPDGVTLVVKLNGATLTAIVLEGASVKLVRCVEISSADPEEIESVVLPTLAYIEDELASTPKRILLCGLGNAADALSYKWANDWSVHVEGVQSRHGAPGPTNAGLLGYLESLG